MDNHSVITLITLLLLINVNNLSVINATINQTNSTEISMENPINTKTEQEIIYHLSNSSMIQCNRYSKSFNRRYRIKGYLGCNQILL